MPRGKYIVIEGPDGTGKTTQAELLSKWLKQNNIRTIHIKEPGGSPMGEAIRGVLLDGTLDRTPMTNALLFTANRHELWHSVIAPALKKGTWVVTTRNYWSTLALQGYGEGMDVSVINAITDAFTSPQYMNPDYALILHFNDYAEQKRRIALRGVIEKPDTFESKDADYQNRVNNGYLKIAQQHSIPVIDAGGTIEAIHQEILSVVHLP